VCFINPTEPQLIDRALDREPDDPPLHIAGGQKLVGTVSPP
jgi:hypothetical protein